MCDKIFGLCLLPAAVVAMVAVGAVGVFNTLRRTFVIHTRLNIFWFCIEYYALICPLHLPWKTIARERSVITVAIIVNRPDTGGAFGWEVEPENVVLQN